MRNGLESYAEFRSLPAELSRGGFSKCRFSRDGGLDFFTAVNAGGVGSMLRWRQNELGELVLSGRTRVW